MEMAQFKLDSFIFNQAELDFSKRKSGELALMFTPMGKFSLSSKNYELNLLFMAKDSDGDNVISVNCLAFFSFQNVTALKDIPDFFYANCIAILFPYIRAFVSTLTLQANIPPIVLPTLNLSQLRSVLKENTQEVK